MDHTHTFFPLPPEKISLSTSCDRSFNCQLRNQPVAPVLFPPVLLSEPASPDTPSLEKPALCKSIVYVPAVVEQQDAGGPVRRKVPTQTAVEKLTRPSACSTSDYCEKIVSSVWEEANDEAQEREMSRCDGRKSGNGVAKQQGIVQALVQDSALRAAKLGQSFQEYERQWRTGLHCNVVEACSRVCCANLVWCVVLGAWLEQKTGGHVGVVETVLATVVCGALFDLLGGHALLIVGPSGSSLVFVVAISTSGERLGVEIVPWMGWIGLWSSLVLLLLAICKASRLTTHMTFFSWDVVRVFVGLTFLWGALEQVVHLFNASVALDSALLSLWLATSAFVLASFLENARHWRAFHPQMCNAIADYGPVLVLLLFTAVPHLPKLSQPQISQVSLPKSGYHTDQVNKLGYIRLRILPFWAILLAVIPGIMLAGMLFICQNANTALFQGKAGVNIVSSGSKTWDLCVLALLTLLCSLFGLPYSCGLLYQSTVHVRALTINLHDCSDLENQQGLISKVAAQRISGLVASILSGLPVLPLVRWLVDRIPLAVLTGLFLQLACQSLSGWNVIAFIRAFLKGSRTPSNAQSRFSVVAVGVYSAAQISCIFLVFTLSKTPAAVLFPLFVLATFCLRHYVMRSLFRRESFAKLDPTLVKEYSDLSITEPSIASPEHRPSHAWPQLTLQSLKTAISAPIAQASPRMEAESIESPVPRTMSPSLLSTSHRRLKERSRRRHRRKKQTSSEMMEGAEVDTAEHEVQRELSIPPLVKAMLEEHILVTTGTPSQYDEDIAINLSKRVSPRLSPQFFKRSKQNAGWESPLEVHSNLLYNPMHKITRIPKPQSNSTGAQGLDIEERIDSRMASYGQTNQVIEKQISHESAANHARDNEIEILDSRSQNEEMNTERQSSAGRPSPIRAVDGEHEKEEIVFQSSPGIGRCIRSPSFKPKTDTRKKKPLHFSKSASRGRTPSKEDIFPRNEKGEPGAPGSLYGGLRKSRTSRWPTTTKTFLQKVQDHLSQQRQAASQSKDCARNSL